VQGYLKHTSQYIILGPIFIGILSTEPSENTTWFPAMVNSVLMSLLIIRFNVLARLFEITDMHAPVSTIAVTSTFRIEKFDFSISNLGVSYYTVLYC
jgi:hypothetical protein